MAECDAPEYLSSSQLVNDKYSQSQMLVEGTKSDLNNYSNNLYSFLDALAIPGYYYDTINVSIPGPAYLIGNPPTRADVHWPVVSWPSAPAAPSISDLPGIVLEEAPRNTTEDPGFDLPQKPLTNVVTPPGDAPILVELELPPMPVFDIPVAPDLAPIVIPDTPDYSVPGFDAIMPVLPDIQLPQEIQWEESPYNSPIWNDLLGKVRDGIKYGGTGLAPEIECLIYSSARYRQEVEEEQAFLDVQNRYAGKGFDIPAGAQVSLEQHVINESRRNKTELNSKIAIDQAELAQKNTHFMLDKGVELEKILIGFYDSQASRALEAARAIADNGLALFGLAVQRQNAILEFYKAELAGYEMALRASMAELEAFKIEVEGKKVAVEAQRAVVDIYTAQIGALEVRSKLYIAEVEGVKAAAELESLKMENFKLETEIYGLGIEANKALYSMYNTEVDAERAKIQAYSERIKAYGEEVNAVKVINDGKIQALSVHVTQQESEIAKYKAEVDGYSSETNAISSQFDVATKELAVKTDQYKAEVDFIVSKNNLNLKTIDANIAGQKLNLEQQLAKVKSHTDGYVALKRIEGDVRTGILNATAQLMSAAMNSVSASASMSSGSTSSWSVSNSYSSTTSDSNAYTENHNYNESV